MRDLSGEQTIDLAQRAGVTSICGSQCLVIASGLDAPRPGDQQGLERLGSQRGAGVCVACAGQVAAGVVGVTDA